MRVLVTTLAAAALAAPLPAFAQDYGPDADVDTDTEVAAAQIEAALGNPAVQAAVAEGMAAASEAMLDLPLAPLARAVAQAAGEDPEEIDPDMTMRSVSPRAQEVPDRVRESLPRMMGAMGSMAGGIGAMMPALREMAERMRAAIEDAGTSARY
ncbi:hypothetical protein N0B51_01085 [Tsuneonella sp. YG55]|uniref:Uncharacterized protein n=1 Tax=Tsuneonella litorea TaxID=2976475 RepID=A0A9X3A6Q1_9SPHN|nr:hypothetical protein [Tsuneonella litorea]MCT2557566.1 hypothetical protein [Tsuneonella litorea]